jgi:outer membrane protein OmpA-like peptidoglycan-associated protein
MKKYCFLVKMGLFVAVFGSFFVFCPPKAAAEEFLYKYEDGDTYRILSTVQEDVYVDRRLIRKAEILNRIAVKVASLPDGKGRHEAVFQTSERTIGGPGTANSSAAGSKAPAAKSFRWEREYESVFDRDKLGIYTIDPKYYMPVVRNVPVFPGRDLKPGEKWTAEGHEMHDFRDSFGIPEPYRIPFTADYTFLGQKTWKGKAYSAFSVSYRIFFEPEAETGRIWPKRILGASDQTVYWDTAIGQSVAYEETFRMVFTFSDGMTVEYRGKANSEILESRRMDKEKVAQDINDDIKRLGIEDTTARVVDEGIAISLENIQFQADSTVLMPGERSKLDKIAEILLRYKERDILVAGHTAMAGTAEGRMELSRGRAALIADYLIGKGVRSADRVVVRGFGA